MSGLGRVTVRRKGTDDDGVHSLAFNNESFCLFEGLSGKSRRKYKAEFIIR